MKKYISLAQAGVRSYRSAEEWQALCQAGEIDCRQHNDTWFVAESCLHRESVSFRPTSGTSKIPAPSRFKPSRNILSGLLGIFVALVLLAGLSFSIQSGALDNVAAIALNVSTSSATSTATTAPSVIVDASSSSSGFSFQSMGQTLDHWWQELSELIVYLVERVSANWNIFLGRTSTIPSSSPDSSDSSLTDQSATSTALQKVIDERINSQLKNLLGSGAYYAGSSGSPSQGVVVVPSTGDAISDAAIRERIGSTFSDQVSVRFDPSGLTGVITPIFQKVPNDNYLFLITPVRKP
jgi:hypothetical protein